MLVVHDAASIEALRTDQGWKQKVLATLNCGKHSIEHLTLHCQKKLAMFFLVLVTGHLLKVHPTNIDGQSSSFCDQPAHQQKTLSSGRNMPSKSTRSG